MISKGFFDSVEKQIRYDERTKMKSEGYIHKSDCPKQKDAEKIRQLKKANNSLQRKVTELTLELEAIKLMR